MKKYNHLCTDNYFIKLRIARVKIFKKNLFRKIRNRADRQTFTNQKINVCFLIVLKISNKLRIINFLLQKSRPGSYQHGIPPLTTAFKLVFKRKSSTFWTFVMSPCQESGGLHLVEHIQTFFSYFYQHLV